MFNVKVHQGHFVRVLPYIPPLPEDDIWGSLPAASSRLAGMGSLPDEPSMADYVQTREDHAN